MGKIWSEQNKFQKMMEVEIAVALVQAERSIIPKSAAKAIEKKAKFSVSRIKEIESTTKHDVIAFVSNLAENVGAHGKFIHFGMTSSDVLDTAMSLVVRQAGEELLKAIGHLQKAFVTQIKKHKDTLCSGRTHGMHAEPTSFGMKLSGFLAELIRNKKRLVLSLQQMNVGKLSGAVGTYSSQSPAVEKAVCKKLGLIAETIATQVIPRDRHAELFNSLALLGSGIERMAVELRHLQRTEVYEVLEGFSKGQKGSSAMPHKKNPISAENLTGAARLLRSYAQAAMENIALWHERDISHSSVERVIFPDAFILAHYMVVRLTDVMQGLQVDKKRMLENMQLSQGQLFSSHVLLELVRAGYSREQAYAHVQRISHNLKMGESLQQGLVNDNQVKAKVNKKNLNKIFSGEIHKKSIAKQVEQFLSSGRLV